MTAGLQVFDAADADSTQMVRMDQMTQIIHAATVWQWQQK